MKARLIGTAGSDTAVTMGARGAVILLGLLFAGCGGSGGGGSAPAAVDSVSSASGAPQLQGKAANSFAVTADEYGVENATYLSATTSSSGIALRAAVASSMTDPAYRTVSRVDISDPGAVVAGRSYSLGAATAEAPPFAGNLYVFNGHQSTLLQTVGGTITFDSFGITPGETISGSFRALVVDGGDSSTPKASYTIAASFSFTTGGYGPLLPAPQPVPQIASSLYQGNCASCHALGELNGTAGTGPDLALKGGELNALYAAGVPGHKGITLAAADIAALKVLLNVN